MNTGYSYIVKRDYGFAPNPFHGILTLATCKPIIRKSAQIGDFVIGGSDKDNGNLLVFMMKVTEITTFDEYWENPRFRCKKPAMNGSLVTMYGDNIYHHNSEGEWLQENSHHSNDNGSINYENLHRDTGHTDRVLISTDFFYFGKSMIQLPQEFDDCLYKYIGQKRMDTEATLALWKYLEDHFPEKGLIDDPLLFKNFKRYDGIS